MDDQTKVLGSFLFLFFTTMPLFLWQLVLAKKYKIHLKHGGALLMFLLPFKIIRHKIKSKTGKVNIIPSILFIVFTVIGVVMFFFL